MPFNTDGSFTRIPNGTDSWKTDATAGTPIKSDLHDNHDNDLANGLANCITKTGNTQPLADLPMNNKKLINLGQPTNDQDAATKRYVDTMQGWPTAKYISGTDAEGRLNFTGTTGANGITWSNIGAALLARPGVTDRQRNRLSFNNAVDGSGTDVLSVDETDGTLLFPTSMEVACNLYKDHPNGTSYRTPSAGIGGLIRRSGGLFALLGNSVATTLAHGVAALEQWFSLTYSGSVTMILNKKASGQAVVIASQMNAVNRWILNFGNGTAEAADSSGSDFNLVAYNNAGTSIGNAILAYRKTGKVSFPLGITGLLQSDNYYNGPGVYGDGALILGATNSTINIRPVAYNNLSNQSVFNNLGDLTLGRYLIGKGYAECAGTSGTPNASQIFNFSYVDSTNIYCYVGTSHVGNWTPACDYRIKKDIEPLPSTWETVKKLRPVKYTSKAWGDEGLFVDDDKERWGFLAHELQERLLPTAASGEHDGADLQFPDHMTIIAALAAALQEAQVRIEALEDKLVTIGGGTAGAQA
jgi:hypothetical protein